MSDLQNAQLREWLIDAERQRDEAVRLLDEWERQELALALAYCGNEPVVNPGSLIARTRDLLNRTIRRGSEETR